MPPRTPKHRKAKENIHYTEDEYTDQDEEAVPSDEDDFLLAFCNLSVNDILEGKRITWSKQAKALIVQHALAGDAPFTAHSLPLPPHLLTLGQAIGLPLNQGKEVAKVCIEKLVSCIQNTLCPKGLPGLIEERCRSDGSWSIAVSKALIKEARRETFIWRSITNGDVAEKHAEGGRKFRELKNGNDMGKTALVKETMDLLVRGNVITKDSKTSPMKAKLDLSWLKSPSPGPTATSPMPPPAITKTRKSGYYGNFTASASHKLPCSDSDSKSESKSESESESEPKNFVIKSQSKSKAKKPQKKMPSANDSESESELKSFVNKTKTKPKKSKEKMPSVNEYMSGALQPESMDETPTPKPKKSTTANSYTYKSIADSSSGNETPIRKQKKSSSAKKHMSRVPAAAATDSSENESSVPKQQKSSSSTKSMSRTSAAAAATDDSSENETTRVSKQKKSVNRKDKDALHLAAARSESEADTVPKSKSSVVNDDKTSLLSVREQVQGTSRKQKHVSFDESHDELAGEQGATPKGTTSGNTIPEHLHSLIDTLKACGLKPAEIADTVMRKMADEEQAAASKSTSGISYLLDL